jgi:hypothetical protein
LKEEALDRTMWRAGFGRGFGPVVRQTSSSSSSSIGTRPLVGFRPAELSLSIHSGKVLLSAVASGTSNPQLGGEPGI